MKSSHLVGCSPVCEQISHWVSNYVALMKKLIISAEDNNFTKDKRRVLASLQGPGKDSLHQRQMCFLFMTG